MYFEDSDLREKFNFFLNKEKEFLKSETIMWHRRERGETQVEHTELLREVGRHMCTMSENSCVHQVNSLV